MTKPEPSLAGICVGSDPVNELWKRTRLYLQENDFLNGFQHQNTVNTNMNSMRMPRERWATFLTVTFISIALRNFLIYVADEQGFEHQMLNLHIYWAGRVHSRPL